MSFTALSVFYINPPMAQSAQGLEEEQVLGGLAGVGIFQKRKKKTRWIKSATPFKDRSKDGFANYNWAKFGLF